MKMTNVINFLFFKFIRILLKNDTIFNLIKYLQFCILIKIFSIKKIE